MSLLWYADPCLHIVSLQSDSSLPFSSICGIQLGLCLVPFRALPADLNTPHPRLFRSLPCLLAPGRFEHATFLDGHSRHCSSLRGSYLYAAPEVSGCVCVT